MLARRVCRVVDLPMAWWNRYIVFISRPVWILKLNYIIIIVIYAYIN
jgi:hypothetical protein